MTAPGNEYLVRDTDIRLTRIYDAPVSLVWNAWTDPVQVGQWWGPRGFTITTHSRDLRPGGTWVYTMHGPDGKDWPNFTRYLEVVPHSRLVYDHGATDADASPMFRVTATFRDLGGRTELDIVMSLATAEAARETRAFVKAAGGNATWDRLAEHLEKQTSGSDIFVINRSFDVPVETMFALWTTPQHLAAWLPPTGLTMQFHRVDIRSGGSGFYSMGNDSFTMYGCIAYHTIEAPTYLEYVQWFTDADGNVSRHPMSPTWPERMRTRVSFAAEGPYRTRVTVRWSVEGNATAEEMATFIGGRAGMTMGWTGSFDKLEAFIEALPSTTV